MYLGSEKEFLADPNAAPLLEKHSKNAFGTSVPMTRREYRVMSVIYTGSGGKPYLILPHTEEVNFALLYNDLCTLRLVGLSEDAPALHIVKHEAYVLSTSISFSSFASGVHLYLGMALMGDFPVAMEAAGIPLQAPALTFAHGRVTARGSFSIGDTHYLLAEPFSDYSPSYPPIDADQYPRYVTGVGSFYSVGDTGATPSCRRRRTAFTPCSMRTISAG